MSYGAHIAPFDRERQTDKRQRPCRFQHVYQNRTSRMVQPFASSLDARRTECKLGEHTGMRSSDWWIRLPSSVHPPMMQCVRCTQSPATGGPNLHKELYRETSTERLAQRDYHRETTTERLAQRLAHSDALPPRAPRAQPICNSGDSQFKRFPFERFLFVIPI